MNYLRVGALFLLIGGSCLADEVLPTRECLFAYDGGGGVEGQHFEFGRGYTNVHLHEYTIKITAEQRITDQQLLVVVFPKEIGSSFRIRSVRFGPAPHYNLQGPVAKVFGTFIAKINMGPAIRVPMMVPVQISPVSQFTVSPDEALVQGLVSFQKKLPQMVPTPQ